ncbi:MAG TPA: NAD-dependent epimerase/dehydratase family protein, partial [Gammaproteobacteria bacterium]|nr:NAD-dependent epimerase/dehydratase family protein [Gammaproteobacteria bacterium]
MKILITGGTGFIGRRLCRLLVDRNHSLTVLSRNPAAGAGIVG